MNESRLRDVVIKNMDRIFEEAVYILIYNASLRETANHFQRDFKTVQKDMTERFYYLLNIYPNYKSSYYRVQAIIKQHKNEPIILKDIILYKLVCDIINGVAKPQLLMNAAKYIDEFQNSVYLKNKEKISMQTLDENIKRLKEKDIETYNEIKDIWASKYMKKQGFKIDEDTLDQMKKDYQECKSINQVAKKYHFNYRTVKKYLGLIEEIGKEPEHKSMKK